MKRLVLTFGCLLAFASVSYADGSAFTPLNFNDTSYVNPSSSATTAVPTLSEEAIGNGNIQNAISQLESAQVDIRNDLLNYKTKFADVDAQYKLVKAERCTLKKQIRSVEKRIREIDKAKERIRKNML
ncbi:MAG: hypothetical protein MJ230_06750 [bacterium]|nr:hypothetical protein [bacterium]